MTAVPLAPAQVGADGGCPETVLAELLRRRSHTGLRHLVAPAPSDEALRGLLAAAAHAPDHGQLRPWRFIVIGESARARLGNAFADALRERDPQAAPDELEAARSKAWNAPVLVLAVADLRAVDPKVAPAERLVSLGAAIQNVLLAATAQGWATGLTSGQALRSMALRQAFDLAEGEQAVCFIGMGTSTKVKPPRLRPSVDDFVQWL